MNLSITEIAKAVKGEIINKSTQTDRITSVTTDSRKVPANSLFFAIKGEKFDGHDFALQTIKDGAVCVIAQKDAVKRYCLQDINAWIIAVNDTVQALLDTAKYFKSQLKNLDKVVAVTGSVGKTTTKEFTAAVLASKYKTQKSEANYNNEMGLPYTLFSIEEDTEAAVLEMGMNSFGEIKRLSETANPDTAMIINIGTSHIEMLGSREGIKKAKFEILDGMSLNSNIILNADEPLLYCEKNKTGRKEYFFGINNKDADFIAENIEIDYIKNTSSFYVDNFKFEIPATGNHSIYDALPALVTGKVYGLSDVEIQEGFNNFQNAKMRQNIYEFHGITIIDDCYNASKESVLAAFDVLFGIAEKTNGQKIAVLSDILESGDYSEQIHGDIGQAAAKQNISAYLFGEKSKAAFDAMSLAGGDCFYSSDKSDIAAIMRAEVKKGDVILFKASRGMAVETVLADFKKLF